VAHSDNNATEPYLCGVGSVDPLLQLRDALRCHTMPRHSGFECVSLPFRGALAQCARRAVRTSFCLAPSGRQAPSAARTAASTSLKMVSPTPARRRRAHKFEARGLKL
jgi:hypothetical protein